MKKTLQQLVDGGYLNRIDHPTLPLQLYSYTRNTQYEGNWNYITLDCRPLVVDQDFNVVALGFEKFFNYGELTESQKTKLDPRKKDKYNLYDKLDGSLGIVWNYDGKWHVCTRGSFSSEQAIFANNLLYDKYHESLVKLNPDVCYYFEILYPENKIVLEYGDLEDIILLGARKRIDNREYISYDDLISQDLGFPVVKRLNHLKTGVRTWEDLRSLDVPNKEGLIVEYGNGYRFKLKYDWYVKAHRIVSDISNRRVWEYMSENNGKLPESLLCAVPDEFYDWLRGVASELNNKAYHFRLECEEVYDDVLETVGEDMERKEYALFVKSKYPEYIGVFFQMFDGKDISDYVWKKIKP